MLPEIDPAGELASEALVDLAVLDRLRMHSSSVIARVLDYQLLGDIGAELLSRGKVLEVLRSDVDAFGYDVVLELDGIVRHVQLKAQKNGGANDKVSCHELLKSKPSGCLIWIKYDPATFRTVEYGCFGGTAGEPLLGTSDVVSKRSTPNGKGDRPLRNQHRDLKYVQFDKITQVKNLVDWLFGATSPRIESDVPISVVWGPSGTPLKISTSHATVLPISCNLTDQSALVTVIHHDAWPSESGNPREEVSECATILDLKNGTWQPAPRLEDPAIVEVLVEAAKILKESISEAEAG